MERGKWTLLEGGRGRERGSSMSRCRCRPAFVSVVRKLHGSVLLQFAIETLARRLTPNTLSHTHTHSYTNTHYRRSQSEYFIARDCRRPQAPPNAPKNTARKSVIYGFSSAPSGGEPCVALHKLLRFCLR